MAGLGFVAMKLQSFAKAVEFFERAEKNGLRVSDVEKGLSQSCFWLSMGEASKALDQGQLDFATDKYRGALKLMPDNPDALEGLAGALAAAQQYSQAATIFQQSVKIQPKSALAWRGLFLAQTSDGSAAAALFTQDQFPQQVRDQLEKDPEYLGALATDYRKLGRETEATRVLNQALALPFPQNGKGLKADVQLQYAHLLVESKRYEQ